MKSSTRASEPGWNICDDFPFEVLLVSSNEVVNKHRNLFGPAQLHLVSILLESKPVTDCEANIKCIAAVLNKIDGRDRAIRPPSTVPIISTGDVK